MKKVFALLLALVMCVSLIPAAFAADVRTIRFSTASNDGSAIADAMYLFSDKVKEMSDGKINVEIYTGGTLGEGSQTIQNAQLGVQEMTMAQPTALAAMGAKGLTALALPYVFRDLSHQIAVINGEIGEGLLEEVAAAGSGLVGFGYWSEGSRSFFSTKPITCIEDIAGMKLRCMPVDVDTAMVKALGASPTPIDFGELYSALQTKIVDGAENPLDGIYSSKFYEVCKYVTLDEHTMPPTVIVYSELLWNQLSAEEQQILKDAWKVVADTNYDVVNDAVTKFRGLLEDEGVEVIELSDKEKWSDAMAPVYAEFGADCADVIDAILALK